VDVMNICAEVEWYLPWKSDAHWVANHVRVAEDVVEPRKKMNFGSLLYAGKKYLSTSSPLRLFATMSNRKGFSSGLTKE
jgi:hypothetical protein